MADFLWWREGVIYQVYPRSFADGNGDGLGDLPGILAHLDYLAELGIDAIWLSPIQPSPDKDFGYDVSDYCEIDARFGTLEDFDRLVARAHQLGMHVILDMVMNHTSDQHAWFKESRASRENAKRDWYIWKAQPPSGSPHLLRKWGERKTAEQPPSGFPHLLRKWGKRKTGGRPLSDSSHSTQPPSGFPHLLRKWGKRKTGKRPLSDSSHSTQPPSGFPDSMQPPSGFPHLLRKWGKRKTGKRPLSDSSHSTQPPSDFPDSTQPPSGFPHLLRKWGKGKREKRPLSDSSHSTQPPSGFPHLLRKWGKRKTGGRPPSGFPHLKGQKWGKRSAGKRYYPNNWQSQTGGSAWEYDEATGEYYLHLFTKEQPDVNWRNPEVRKEMLEAFRFWLERGVDGFRLDVFNAYFKHADLPDNPPKFGLRGFDRQRHSYDMDQPEMRPFLKELRRLLEAYPERYAVGEPFLPSLHKALSYCGPDGLQAAFSFDFTTPGSELAQALGGYPWNPAWLLAQIQRREQACQAAGVWPTTVLSNHDIPRFASRAARGEEDARAKAGMALLLTLPGTPFLYYGEEIGIRDIHLRRSEILDPPGQRYWPLYKGRDGCRAPMQWDASEYAGFSSQRPWLPLHPDYLQRNVRAQQQDPGSLFNFTKTLLALRKQLPALRRGEWRPVQGGGGVLSYLRRTETQELLVAINFKGGAAKFTVPEGKWELVLSSEAGNTDARGQLKPYEVRLMIRG